MLGRGAVVDEVRQAQLIPALNKKPGRKFILCAKNGCQIETFGIKAVRGTVSFEGVIYIEPKLWSYLDPQALDHKNN